MNYENLIAALSKFGVPAIIALYLVYKLGEGIEALVNAQQRIVLLLEELIRIHGT